MGTTLAHVPCPVLPACPRAPYAQALFDAAVQNLGALGLAARVSPVTPVMDDEGVPPQAWPQYEGGYRIVEVRHAPAAHPAAAAG